MKQAGWKKPSTLLQRGQVSFIIDMRKWTKVGMGTCLLWGLNYRHNRVRTSCFRTIRAQHKILEVMCRGHMAKAAHVNISIIVWLCHDLNMEVRKTAPRGSVNIAPYNTCLCTLCLPLYCAQNWHWHGTKSARAHGSCSKHVCGLRAKHFWSHPNFCGVSLNSLSCN